MTKFSQLPRELVEIILTQLDCAYDISSCALVCHDWLDIVKNHRAVWTEAVYNHTRWPHHTFLRRFKKICIQGSRSIGSSQIDACVLRQAKEVKFDHCIFSSLAVLQECVLACGDLSRLEIIFPSVENCEIRRVTDSMSQKIETLVLHLYDEQQIDILELFQTASIDVTNLELCVDNPTGPEALRPLLGYLEKHYQDKLREVEINEETALECIKDFPRLKLEKLSIFYDDDVECVEKLITSQPTISELKLNDISMDIVDCVLSHLPLLTVLILDCYSLEEMNVVSASTQRLGKLSWLELTLPYGYESPGCDITFITKLPNLRKFSCKFEHGPSVIKFGPIENQMLKMKEFCVSSIPHFVYGCDIDAESLWNIFHKMPNLEHLTMHSEAAGPCQIGTLNSLKKLDIIAAIIDDAESIESMKLPNLRFLKLDQMEWKGTEVMKYFPQIARNCPLLSRIKFNSKLYKRNADGGFEM